MLPSRAFPFLFHHDEESAFLSAAPGTPVPLLLKRGGRVLKRILGEEAVELPCGGDLPEPHLHLHERHRANIFRDVEGGSHGAPPVLTAIRDSSASKPVRISVSPKRSRDLPSAR